MNFLSYINGLLSFFKDKRVITNIEQMIQKVIEKKTIRLYQIADNKNEYNRYKSLLDGSLKSVLDNEKISKALLGNSVDAMSGEEIILIHDPCDIRKRYANKLESIGKVLDLNKKVINGYSTFNTVAIDEKHKGLRLVDTKVYSNRDPSYVTKEELEQYHKGALQSSGCSEQQKRAKLIKELLKTNNYINLSKITVAQLEKTSKSFKKEKANVRIVHVLDCGFDDQKTY